MEPPTGVRRLWGMRRPRSAVLLAAPLALVAGCSLFSPPIPPGNGDVTHPSGSELVVRVAWTGGFVPYESLFTSLPRFTLLGDGRVIVEGPQIEIYPGPALPNLQVRRLTEEGIQSVLFRIGETGLFDESQSFTAANQFVADANTTVFTVHADDREVIVDVYALGIVDPSTAPPGFPPAELEAHQRLSSLESDLMNLDAWIAADDWVDAAWQAYQPEALRLLVANVDTVPPDTSVPTAEPLPWPSKTPPDEFGQPSTVQDFRCGVVSGAEAETWYAALQQANTLTRWSYGDHVYHVTPRPLLPDESLDCGAIEG